MYMVVARELWDERYRQSGYVYGTEPNRFYREQLVKLPPGRILLPCEGEGRNAVFAAQLGWEVDAFDFSEEARNKAIQLAAEYGTKINYFLQAAEDFVSRPDNYDVIALIYAHFRPGVRKTFHRKLVLSLKPGGILLMEAFHKEQIRNTSGGPRDPEMLYDETMLLEDFEQLQISLLERYSLNLDEGEYHQGKADVVRVIAQKF